jgi:hypothetical protein
MTILISRVLLLITELMPCRSSLCGIALPDFDIRATTRTCGKLESFIAGIIAIASSLPLAIINRLYSELLSAWSAELRLNSVD